MKKPTAKSKSASDPQKEKLYEWEGKWLDWNRKQIPLDDCKNYIVGACKLYGVEPPTVAAAGKELDFSGYWHEENAIALISEHQNISSALHEAAHCIVSELAPRAQGHGPMFAGVYIFLLVNAEMCPAEAIYASARKAGIRWSKRATPEHLAP